MTILIPPPPAGGPGVQLAATDPVKGCVVCGEFKTVQLHPYRGRLCPAHAVLPTVPPGEFRADFAAELVIDYGRPDAAFAYLAAWLDRRITGRFNQATLQLFRSRP